MAHNCGERLERLLYSMARNWYSELWWWSEMYAVHDIDIRGFTDHLKGNSTLRMRDTPTRMLSPMGHSSRFLPDLHALQAIKPTLTGPTMSGTGLKRLVSFRPITMCMMEQMRYVIVIAPAEVVSIPNVLRLSTVHESTTTNGPITLVYTCTVRP